MNAILCFIPYAVDLIITIIVNFFFILVFSFVERFYICIALQAKHEKTTLGPFV